MKKKIVKGFTLIELIVVMAIFMVIMAAAVSLMEPVSKMATLADVRDSGAAQVNSISSFLQSELGSAEYLMITNRVTRDGSNMVSDSFCQSVVDEYVQRYYEGVLSKGATTSAPTYGSGKVHVLTIDNSVGGEITERVFDVSFDLNAHCGSPSEKNDHVINRAYYQNTTYLIELGGVLLNNDVDEFASDTDLAAFLSSVSATDTTFNITAQMTRGVANPQTYEFTTSATVPLVNIMERPGPVVGKYFVIKQTTDNSVNPPTKTADIVDLGLAVDIVGQDTDPTNTLTRHKGGLATVSSIYVKPQSGNPTSGPNSAYTFVYSYGNEMDTN